MMLEYRMIRLLNILLLVALGSSGLDSNLLPETLRSACPYSDFCTVRSLMTLNRSMNTQPCCFDCFCDGFSVVFGDSCPDYVPKETKVQLNGLKDVLECKPFYFENKYTLSKNNTFRRSGIGHLRFIDFCPVDADSNARDKCTGNNATNPRFDDTVAVSTKDGVLIKNKHCARCHGETNVNRWNIKILRCNDRLEDLQLSASNMEDYILQNCLVSPSRPEEVPMTSRALDCRDSLLCDKRLGDPNIESCLNGTRMPFVHVNTFGYTSIYRNVFCASCLNETSKICPKVDQIESNSVEFSPFEVLNLLRSNRQPTAKCSDNEIFDHRKGQCRRMYCPQFEIYVLGTCFPITARTTSLYAPMNIIYKPKETQDTRFLKSITENYNPTQGKIYFKSLENEFQVPACQVSEMIANAVFDKDKTFLFISLDLVYKLSLNCTLRDLGDKMRNVSIKNRTWVLEGTPILFIGQVTFFDMTQGASDKIRYGLFSFFSRITYTVNKFFLCPYFIFSLDELRNDTNTRTEVLGNNLKYIRKLEPSFEYPRGTYPLSESEVAVCIDSINLNRNQGEMHITKTWILVAFCG